MKSKLIINAPYYLIKVNRIFIYVRVSTNKQDMSNMLQECRDYCKYNNWIVYKEITICISAKYSRTARSLDFLMNEVQSGDIVLTTELSRLGRNVAENRELFLEFKKKNVEVVFTRASHKILNDRLLGGLLFEVLSLFTEIERSMISERTKMALQARKDSGRKLGRYYGEDYIHPKLKDKQAVVHDYLKNRISKKGIARLLGVSDNTLLKFIRRYKLG